MTNSRELQRLTNSWERRSDWPKHLEWVEITGLRGWSGERIDFYYPFVAIVGENGVGKSTILQSVASLFRSPHGTKTNYASDFFPDTPWEHSRRVSLRYSYRQGTDSQVYTVRKPSTRWRGNQQRPERSVVYVDLRRTQPFSARTGYLKLAKANISESSAESFDDRRLSRLSSVIGRRYTGAKHAITHIDPSRKVPVVGTDQGNYSGFHQGAGETTVVDLLALNIPPYSVVLIDEIETSLHPRAQRRLICDLAEICRQQKAQIIVTTHSP